MKEKTTTNTLTTSQNQKIREKKRLVYVDEIDGNDDNEYDNDEEPEELDKDDAVEYVKVIKKKKPVGKKLPKKETTKKIGITKSI